MATDQIVVVPLEALHDIGRVQSYELTKEGIWLDVIGPDDVPGQWDYDYSSWPVETRPVFVRPEMALALRSNYGGLGMIFLDAAGHRVLTGPFTTGGDDQPHIFYWTADQNLDDAASLQITIMRD